MAKIIQLKDENNNDLYPKTQEKSLFYMNWQGNISATLEWTIPSFTSYSVTGYMLSVSDNIININKSGLIKISYFGGVQSYIASGFLGGLRVIHNNVPINMGLSQITGNGAQAVFSVSEYILEVSSGDTIKLGSYHEGGNGVLRIAYATISEI